MTKRTYQPKKRKRARTHGFRLRMRTKSGRSVLKRRRVRGRKLLTVVAKWWCFNALISIEVIKKSRDFLKIISIGRKLSLLGVVIYYLRDSNSENLKIGISIKKKVGSAVVRNKLKRQIKALSRNNAISLSGIVMIMIIKENKLNLNYEFLSRIFDSFINKVKDIRETNEC